MKRGIFTFILLMAVTTVLTQCGSADAGKKTADEFFSRIIKKDFEKAASMIERPSGDTTDFLQQVRWMENNPTNGQLLSFKKSIGFNTSISNGVTTVEIPYILRYDMGDQTVSVVIKNRGSGNKIVSVQ